MSSMGVLLGAKNEKIMFLRYRPSQHQNHVLKRENTRLNACTRNRPKMGKKLKKN